MFRATTVLKVSSVGPLILFIAGCGAGEAPAAESGDPAPGGAEVAPSGSVDEETPAPDRGSSSDLAPRSEPVVVLPAGGAANDNDETAADETATEETATEEAATEEAATDESGALIRGPAPTIQLASTRGGFDVESSSSGLRDGPDYGSQTLHYPTDAEPPFAAVVVVPGFLSPESSIEAWGPFLASHGIVTLTIGTNSPSDQPAARAAALLDGLETITAENGRAGGPLAGKLDPSRFGVMGWSMGGGGTLIAASGTPTLKAAVTLAAWSPGVTFADDQVPTLLLAGSADTLAGGQSQGFFSSIPETTPKMLFEVAGGSHSVANDPSGAGGEIGRFGLSWLKVFLEGDERYRPLLLQVPTQQSEFDTNL